MFFFYRFSPLRLTELLSSTSVSYFNDYNFPVSYEKASQHVVEDNDNRSKFAIIIFI